MLSYEINSLMASNNYYIDSKTYINILLSSPQISGIKYNPYEKFFEMCDEENNYWKFSVYRKDD